MLLQEDDNILWLAAPHHGMGGNMHILSVALTHAYIHSKALGIVGEVQSRSLSDCLAFIRGDLLSPCLAPAPGSRDDAGGHLP